MSESLHPNVPFIVLRESDGGRFVRAFVDAKTANDFVNGSYLVNNQYTVHLELSHEPDEKGNIFHLFPPINEGV